MNARKKLNVAYFNGCVIAAGMIGLTFGSWLIFLLALIVLMIGNLNSGGIRPNHRH